MKNRIKAIREECKLTQEKFADSIGLSQNYIAQVEIGKKNLGGRAIGDICRIYGINESWLRDGTGPMHLENQRRRELSALVRNLMDDSPESFRTALITALLRFDPNGPQWQVLESIYQSIADELENADK